MDCRTGLGVHPAVIVPSREGFVFQLYFYFIFKHHSLLQQKSNTQMNDSFLDLQYGTTQPGFPGGGGGVALQRTASGLSPQPYDGASTGSGRTVLRERLYGDPRDPPDGGYFREPDVFSYHSNAALVEDSFGLPEEEKCTHCGYELSLCEVCPVSGLLHEKPSGARPTRIDTLCTECNGVVEEAVKPHMHRQQLVAARMRQVQRELFSLATQPRGPSSYEDSPLWPRIQRLEKDKTFLISSARQLGLQVPSQQPPPRCPVDRPDIPPEVLEADSLDRFNQGLRALIEETIIRIEKQKQGLA